MIDWYPYKKRHWRPLSFHTSTKRPREKTLRRQPSARQEEGPHQELNPAGTWLLDFPASILKEEHLGEEHSGRNHRPQQAPENVY